MNSKSSVIFVLIVMVVLVACVLGGFFMKEFGEANVIANREIAINQPVENRALDSNVAIAQSGYAALVAVVASDNNALVAVVFGMVAFMGFVAWTTGKIIGNRPPRRITYDSQGRIIED